MPSRTVLNSSLISLVNETVGVDEGDVSPGLEVDPLSPTAPIVLIVLVVLMVPVGMTPFIDRDPRVLVVEDKRFTRLALLST